MIDEAKCVTMGMVLQGMNVFRPVDLVGVRVNWFNIERRCPLFIQYLI